MEVTDSDWVAAFGTSDSQLEPIPKLGKVKLNRAQLAAKMILDTARLRDAASSERTLFDLVDGSQSPSTRQ